MTATHTLSSVNQSRAMIQERNPQAQLRSSPASSLLSPPRHPYPSSAILRIILTSSSDDRCSAKTSCNFFCFRCHSISGSLRELCWDAGHCFKWQSIGDPNIKFKWQCYDGVLWRLWLLAVSSYLPMLFRTRLTWHDLSRCRADHAALW